MIYRIDKITSGRPCPRLHLSNVLMDNILFKSKYQERKRDGRAAMAGKIRFQNPAHHVNPVYSFPLRWASDMIYRIDKITSGRPCPRLHLSNVLMDHILFKSEYQERKRDGRAGMAGKIRPQELYESRPFPVLAFRALNPGVSGMPGFRSSLVSRS